MEVTVGKNLTIEKNGQSQQLKNIDYSKILVNIG
jgi:hypothetical protein